jgi:hypothetical protein
MNPWMLSLANRLETASASAATEYTMSIHVVHDLTQLPKVYSQRISFGPKR